MTAHSGSLRSEVGNEYLKRNGGDSARCPHFHVHVDFEEIETHSQNKSCCRRPGDGVLEVTTRKGNPSSPSLGTDSRTPYDLVQHFINSLLSTAQSPRPSPLDIPPNTALVHHAGDSLLPTWQEAGTCLMGTLLGDAHTWGGR